MWRVNFRTDRLFAIVVFAALSFAGGAAQAQTTAFTYQGRLTDGGTAANGTYDLQFTLWDAMSGGTQQPQPNPAPVLRPAVLIESGVFTVQLDFTVTAFPGADRYLEISVKHPADSTFIVLSPRQQLTSNPYAVRTLSATAADGLSSACVSCVRDSQINSVAGSKVSGEIPVASLPPGSTSYIQNGTAPQAPAGFNVNGDGTAGGTLSGGVVNSATEYDLSGSRVLSLSGSANFPRTNTFLGDQAGVATTPSDNPSMGLSNSFFGSLAGSSNTSGFQNSFFGTNSGTSTTAGVANSFFGQNSGPNNISGNSNTFLGKSAGFSHFTGNANTYVGTSAGFHDFYGSANTFVGAVAGTLNVLVSNATAIGANADVEQSNSLVLGSIAGVNGAALDTSVGIGTTTPQARFNVVGTSWLQGDTTPLPASAGKGVALGFGSSIGGYVFAYDYSAGAPQTLSLNSPGGNVGIGLNEINPRDALEVNGIARILTYGTAGSIPLCINSLLQLSTCSSSLRYKTDLHSFASGLALINKLSPITFRWKADGSRDLGFAAEAVARVEPLLVTHNAKGEIEGVKYDRLSAVFVNAFKEQQSQIEQQQKLLARQQDQIKLQQAEIDELKRLVCSRHRTANGCRQR